jgi:hypothetical protein
MLLAFGDDRLDLGNFMRLMPERLVIISARFRAPTATLTQFEWNDRIALFGPDQWPSITGMPRLPTTIVF